MYIVNYWFVTGFATGGNWRQFRLTLLQRFVNSKYALRTQIALNERIKVAASAQQTATKAHKQNKLKEIEPITVGHIAHKIAIVHASQIQGQQHNKIKNN